VLEWSAFTHRGRVTRRVFAAAVAVCVAAVASWGMTRGVGSDLAQETRAALQRLVAAGPGLPAGDDRLAALWRAAFAGDPARAATGAVQANRAAILALGIAVGHERLAPFAGLDRDDDLVRAAAQLRQGASLRGREDWPRHYWLSAGLAVVESPFFSEVGGVLKEQLDALGKGSGFSFGDLAADRAGIRFASIATQSEAHALALRARLRAGFRVDDYFPAVADLPENLTTEEFKARFGSVGSPAYRQLTADIDARIDRCPGLTEVPTPSPGIR
jgi:hypothetical protein